jgi:hypothetical protein
MFRPMKGRIAYWLRQPSDTGEKTIDKILVTMKTYGNGSCLAAKVADGLTWQGDIDGTFPCHSISDVLAIKKLCEDNGCSFIPVFVPRGKDPVGEGKFHGAIASAVGAGKVDLEPYTGFYDSNPTTTPQYAAQLQNSAQGVELVVEPDPRTYGLSGIQFDAVVQYFTGISGQHYVGWTSVGWNSVANEVAVFNRLAAYGKDMYVTLYGEEDQNLPVQFWDQVKHKALGACMFAFGPMNGSQLKNFAKLDLSTLPVPDPIGPQPNPTPTDEIAFRLAIAQLSGANIADITDLQQPLSDTLTLVEQTAQAVVANIENWRQTHG